MNNNITTQKLHLQQAINLLSMIENCEAAIAAAPYDSAWWYIKRNECVDEYAKIMSIIIVDHTEETVSTWSKIKRLFKA